jgi:hypothetical protein
MIRLSMLGGTMIYHGKYFGHMFNGCANRELWDKHKFGGDPSTRRRIEEARVVKVYDEDRKNAEILAAVVGIDHVCDDITECGKDVDGILIADDCTSKHYRFADPLWKFGKPIFIDKPLAGTIEEAEAVIAKAEKHKVPIFSASGLQYTREIAEAKPQLEKLGDIMCAVSANPNELVFYGIHGLAMLWQLYGPGIESVQNLGEGNLDLVKYRWRDGHIGVQVGLEGGSPGWKLTVFAQKGRLDIPTGDADAFYCNVQRHFVEMVKTGKQPLPNKHMLEIIRALCLAKKSKALGTGEIIKL